MTTLTNSEGRVLTYTNDFLETILLQLNSSTNYYTSGEYTIIFIKEMALIKHCFYIIHIIPTEILFRNIQYMK